MTLMSPSELFARIPEHVRDEKDPWLQDPDTGRFLSPREAVAHASGCPACKDRLRRLAGVA